MDGPFVIDLNEMFDYQDAMAEEFFDKHPPRVEHLPLKGNECLMVQFSLLEGIWVEHEEQQEKCTVVGWSFATFCIKEAREKLEKWLEKHEYLDKIDKYQDWIETNWELYKKSREGRENKPKSVHVSLEKQYHERLKKHVESGSTSFRDSGLGFYLNDHGGMRGMRIIFHDPDDAPENLDECFFHEDDGCTAYGFYSRTLRECIWEGIENRKRCGSYCSWKNVLKFNR